MLVFPPACNFKHHEASFRTVRRSETQVVISDELCADETKREEQLAEGAANLRNCRAVVLR
jgi:hypothetical protein